MSFCGWGNEKYKDHFADGIYVCSSCDTPLFRSVNKFEHNSPWPAFSEPVDKGNISYREESTNAYKVSCASCGQGLGHEFKNDGPDGGSRY